MRQEKISKKENKEIGESLQVVGGSTSRPVDIILNERRNERSPISEDVSFVFVVSFSQVCASKTRQVIHLSRKIQILSFENKSNTNFKSKEKYLLKIKDKNLVFFWYLFCNCFQITVFYLLKFKFPAMLP